MKFTEKRHIKAFERVLRLVDLNGHVSYKSLTASALTKLIVQSKKKSKIKSHFFYTKIL